MSRTKRKERPSSAQNLRYIFHKLWKKDPEEFIDNFNGYYDDKMDKIICHYQNKIKK